ncbi:hypothetical protein REPUB_Repub20aG0063400 [Reevesia pubescens]
MEESLSDLWNRFNLIEDEQSEVLVEKEWFVETLKKLKNYLVGKILSSRVVNADVLHSIFTKVWKISRGL